MQPDGTETLARWHESGEWWNGETGQEVHRFIDTKGTRREIASPLAPPQPEVPSDVRVRPIRDEKISLAIGAYIPNRTGEPIKASANGVLLHGLSAYAFGRGTIHAGELAVLAGRKGYGSVLLADPFSLVGAREFCRTAYECGVKPLVGATFEMTDGGQIVLVAKDETGYRSLSRLITVCHLGEPRLYPLCTWERLEHHREGLLCLTGGSMGPVDLSIIRRDFQGAASVLDRLIGIYGRADVFVQIERSYLPWQIMAEPYLRRLAEDRGIVMVAGGPILFAEPNHFPAHDVLVCIDSLCLVEETEGRKAYRDPSQPQIKGLPRRSLNSARSLRPYPEVKALFVDSPELIAAQLKVAERCAPRVLPGRIDLPRFCQDEDSELYLKVMAGAQDRYGVIPRKVFRRLEHELARLANLDWSRHFLIAADLCDWAKSQKILLSGRGSVVDSLVAYCLGISRIDADQFDLHFDRFLPADGSKRPDIDIDFEAARREDVRQYLVKRYGDAHVATVAAIGTYRTRGIVREVGKVMGIPEESISFLAKRLHGSVSAERLEAALDSRPELRDSNIPRERFEWVFRLTELLMDIPRNLRAHSSGVILSTTPIADTVPVQFSGADGVKIIQWDKRSAKHSFDKFDVLCLRGNDVLGGTARRVGDGLDVTGLPLDDPNVYRAMRAGQLIGIPQSASPAMRQAHIRTGTSNLKDAGIVQAAIRPGVGGAVKLNEYVARRNGKGFDYSHPDLEPILGPTLGIVVFQEQIDQLLSKFGGYSGGKAEEIREQIQRHNDRGRDELACPEVLEKIIKNGYPLHVAQDVYELIAGFKGYGFAEGHALSFAEISIRSIYCQQNYPAPYFAALLDAQPAGYYGPVTITNEARSRGVKILRPDINLSTENFLVEDILSDEPPKIGFPGGAIRVPLNQVSILSAATRERALAGRPYASFFDFVTRTRPARDELETLILVGAFDSIHPNRRALLWAVPSALAHGNAHQKTGITLPLTFEDPPIPLGVDDFGPGEKAIYERQYLGLDVERHLMAFERTRISVKGGLTAMEASNLQSNDKVFVVGNPIRLRFPPTQSGKRVMFFDLEDETGLLNVTCFDDVYQRDGHKVICNPYITLWGETQNRDGHIAFLAHRILAYSPRMEGVAEYPKLPIVTGDFLMT